MVVSLFTYYGLWTANEILFEKQQYKHFLECKIKKRINVLVYWNIYNSSIWDKCEVSAKAKTSTTKMKIRWQKWNHWIVSNIDWNIVF